MPESRSSTSSSDERSWAARPGASCTALFLGLAFGGVIVDHAWGDRLLLASSNPSATVWALLNERIDSAPAADVLLLGDSSLRSSVDPQLMQALTGRSTVNLGFVLNGEFETDHELFRRWLARRAAPKVVVLVHDPRVWNGAGMDRRLGRLVASPRLTVRRVLDSRITLSDGLGELLAWTSPSVQAKPYLLPRVRRALGTNQWANPLRDFIAEGRRLGFFPDASGRPREPIEAPSGEVVAIPDGLRRLVALAGTNDVRVYYYPGPVAGPIGARERWQGHEARATDTAMAAGLRVLTKAGVRLNGDEVGTQINHASHVGARKVTRHLARLLMAVGRIDDEEAVRRMPKSAGE